MITKIFGLSSLRLDDDASFYALVIANNLDMSYIAQSFPTVLANSTEPIQVKDVCLEADGCRTSPNWNDFLGLGIRDTIITHGLHYGSPIAWRGAQRLWRAFRGTPAAMGAYGGVATNAARELPNVAVNLLGSSTSLALTGVYELAPLAAAPAGAATGIVVQSSQRGTSTAEGLLATSRMWRSTPNLLPAANELISAGGLASVRMEAAGVASGVRVVSRAAKTTRVWSGLTKLFRAIRVRREVPSNNTTSFSLRERRSPLGRPLVEDTIQPTALLNVSATAAKTFRTCCHPQYTVPPRNGSLPKWIRSKRGLWTGIHKIAAGIPSWVYPSVSSAALWVVHGNPEELSAVQSAQDSAEQPAEEPAEQPAGEQHARQQSTIHLSHVLRAPNTSNSCIVFGCQDQSRYRVPKHMKIRLLHENYYVPPAARICQEHLQLNDFEVLLSANNISHDFNEDQIMDMMNILKSAHQVIGRLDFENIENMDPNELYF
ncbi:unnamed protein product, partial [Brenthis ino]